MHNTGVVTAPRRCLLTGASGYLGRQIKRRLTEEGWEVIELSRNPRSGSIERLFRLGEPVNEETLVGCDALVHCAYDFEQIEWNDIYTVNVGGSILLLNAAYRAGIKRLIYISSISAFPGCKSLYGKAKLEVERTAQRLGGWVIRPGLIYGDDTGGMVGRLAAQVRRARFLPMPGGGQQQMYLVHQDDIAEVVCRAGECQPAEDAVPVTVAHSRAFTFYAVIDSLTRVLRRKVVVVPVPWQLMWLGLRGAEICRLRLPLRSDSLVSLMNQDRSPLLNAYETFGVKCRSFDSTTSSLFGT